MHTIWGRPPVLDFSSVPLAPDGVFSRALIAFLFGRLREGA